MQERTAPPAIGPRPHPAAVDPERTALRRLMLRVAACAFLAIVPVGPLILASTAGWEHGVDLARVLLSSTGSVVGIPAAAALLDRARTTDDGVGARRAFADPRRRTLAAILRAACWLAALGLAAFTVIVAVITVPYRLERADWHGAVWMTAVAAWYLGLVILARRITAERRADGGYTNASGASRSRGTPGA